MAASAANRACGGESPPASDASAKKAAVKSKDCGAAVTRPNLRCKAHEDGFGQRCLSRIVPFKGVEVSRGPDP